LRAFGAWRAFCLQAGATGAGLRTFIRARAAPARLAVGRAGAEPSPAAGGPGGRSGRAARAACLPIPLPIHQPASRNGWQIPKSNFGFRF